MGFWQNYRRFKRGRIESAWAKTIILNVSINIITFIIFIVLFLSIKSSTGLIVGGGFALLALIASVFINIALRKKLGYEISTLKFCLCAGIPYIGWLVIPIIMISML